METRPPRDRVGGGLSLLFAFREVRKYQLRNREW